MILGFPLVHRLVHGALEVVAEVVPELLAHLLHEATDAGRVVLVEVAEVAGIAQRVQALVFRPDAGEPRHQPGQGGASAARTGGRGRGGGAQNRAGSPPVDSHGIRTRRSARWDRSYHVVMVARGRSLARTGSRMTLAALLAAMVVATTLARPEEPGGRADLGGHPPLAHGHRGADG